MFSSNDSDAHWERFGQIDPYFGVLSDPKYHQNNLTPELLNEFFASGEAYIRHVLETVKTHVLPEFQPVRALDFGCGVGRLVMPLSRVSQAVVGVDVSQSMLQEAQRNCQQQGVTNVQFVKSDDQLSAVTGNFNLIHSVIVFQHIPSKRGIQIIKYLLRLLENDGIAVLHIPYKVKGSTQLANQIFRLFPFSAGLYNLLKRRSFNYPLMQANSYNLGALVHLFRQHGCSSLYIETQTTAYFESVTLYSQKQHKPHPMPDPDDSGK